MFAEVQKGNENQFQFSFANIFLRCIVKIYYKELEVIAFLWQM